MMQMVERLSMRVVGRVQGVGFRHFVRGEARRLGLVGWVRNERNGGVALEAEGSREALEVLVQRVGQGPPSAHVVQVDVSWHPATGAFEAFEVRFF